MTTAEGINRFAAGERVVYRSHPSAKPETGVVIRDTITALVFVDYGKGAMATRRGDLTRDVDPRLAACIHESGCDDVSHDLRCNDAYYGGAR
ncbi:MAG: hypothetical protein ACRDTJ_03855 [Pseudonocardiaceae bacterium]